MTHFIYLCPSQNAVLLCLPPLLYFLGGVAGRLSYTRMLSVNSAWSLARVCSAASLLFALACCFDLLVQISSMPNRLRIGSLVQFGAAHLSFRFDTLETLMLLLVTFLGWVIVGYSCKYMAGDPKGPQFIGNLMFTLASVSLLIVTNSLVLFLLAWVLTSLSLHGLLTLYPNRQAAVIAAHKKFLASRLGDLTLLCAVVLLGSQTGSFEMDEVIHRIAEFHSVPLSIHVAVLLLAISAMIKCAQLPLHGWLIQVMEAPTPVSALLHAGVVNLGGFMLIRLALVINTTPAAQDLLVLIGCLTATISALVMTTRISIKVNLAWSTCAQMGFMLMECGLGLYDLALLHLLAHSLYKAYTFLSSGGTVNQAKLKRMMSPRPKLSFTTSFGSGFCGLLIATLGAMLWRHDVRMDAAMMLFITIVGLAIAGILAASFSLHGWAASLILIASAIGVSLLYFGYEALFQHIVPMAAINFPQPRPILVFSLVCFVLLYIIQTMVRVNPLGKFATALYPWFYAGLYLDEVFTRLTFRVWPANQISIIAPPCDVTGPFDTGEAGL